MFHSVFVGETRLMTIGPTTHSGSSLSVLLYLNMNEDVDDDAMMIKAQLSYFAKY